MSVTKCLQILLYPRKLFPGVLHMTQILGFVTDLNNQEESYMNCCTILMTLFQSVMRHTLIKNLSHWSLLQTITLHT